jgi:hypothetical protein
MGAQKLHNACLLSEGHPETFSAVEMISHKKYLSLSRYFQANVPVGLFRSVLPIECCSLECKHGVGQSEW